MTVCTQAPVCTCVCWTVPQDSADKNLDLTAVVHSLVTAIWSRVKASMQAHVSNVREVRSQRAKKGHPRGASQGAER
jgi:hypothetical protein